ncbi:beta-1,3-N-acetylglucosaminyltransferase manic fringe-like [Dysidea avara]|uniref:beta-1,3-N-acetylglucosaminyltransferase manic fringe-like n=1 Tax=Dysidea avara TaxID=196820 RepID=UPI00332E9C85
MRVANPYYVYYLWSKEVLIKRCSGSRGGRSMFDRYLRTIQLCMTGMVCVVVAVLLTYDWSPESSSVFVHSDILMAEFSEDLSSTIDKVNNLGKVVNSSRDAPQMDGKLVESTSTKSSKILSIPLEKAPIKINGKPLEKVNVNYIHNIYFSVKSCSRNYKTRVFTSMLTWFQVLDKDELAIISDNSSAVKPYTDIVRRSGFNLIISSCKDDHSRYGLCCKTGIEFSSYYKALEKHNDNKDRYQWYCHVDDDEYVNVPQLSHVLQQYDPSKPYYIGKFPWNLRRKFSENPYIRVDDDARVRIKQRNLTMMANHYQYATGASYCLSYALMMKGKDFFNGIEELTSTCELAGNTDDIAIGFIIEVILGYNLTDTEYMFNQYDELDDFSIEQISKFLTVSFYVKKGKTIHAVPLQYNIPGDRSRFMAYHCLLYPSVSWCPR